MDERISDSLRPKLLKAVAVVAIHTEVAAVVVPTLTQSVVPNMARKQVATSILPMAW